MKRTLFTGIAAVLLISGLMMLIAPRISNRIGEQIAHSTIDDFKALKSKATSDEPTEKKESSEDSSANTKPKKNNAQNEYASIVQNNDGTIFEEELSMSENTTVDFDRLYSDSIAYNENLKKHQHELLTNEQSYQSPALNLSSYGITNGVFGYISAPAIGLELPIYLGGNDDNMALGAAHMTYTSLPIGGESTNCVLSGHSGYVGRIFFDYIPSLSIGDEITVENYWDTLTYKVVDKQIHKEDESADCYISEGRDLLTLITCVSNGRGGFDRFYLICERKST
ncbi:MAG: class C sortase [Ruminococcus sp.]|nr:class C sortase [Ruminococcus sp.]